MKKLFATILVIFALAFCASFLFGCTTAKLHMLEETFHFAFNAARESH